MNKIQEIKKYSNPDKVFKRLKEIYPQDNFKFKISGRKNKKYAINGEFTNNKWVHFGFFGMEDFTKHNDENRQNNFLNRNWKWATKPIYTPSYLSYWALWT
jgi:hypothetical protein